MTEISYLAGFASLRSDSRPGGQRFDRSHETVQFPGGGVYIGRDTAPLYIGIIYSHCKDPEFLQQQFCHPFWRHRGNPHIGDPTAPGWVLGRINDYIGHLPQRVEQPWRGGHAPFFAPFSGSNADLSPLAVDVGDFQMRRLGQPQPLLQRVLVALGTDQQQRVTLAQDQHAVELVEPADPVRVEAAIRETLGWYGIAAVEIGPRGRSFAYLSSGPPAELRVIRAGPSGEAVLSEEITTELAGLNRRAEEMERDAGLDAVAGAAEVRSGIPALEFEQAENKREMIQLRLDLHHLKLQAVEVPGSGLLFFAADNDEVARTEDRKLWRFQGVSNGEVTLSAGGDVVGVIPAGLPSFEAPVIQWDLVLALLPAALVMALIGFMEATSISKAIATDTGERVSANKELIGQGLANIAGSFFSAFTVSGSFSRSAVAARAGAKTGLFAIISALAVVLVLLFFTEYLYDLPQAVLAVIVMMAVFSLIRIKPLVQAWKVDKVGALTGVITFVATLVMAPAIANGILIGVGLTILYCLVRTMKPRADIVSRKPDGTLGGMRAHHLQPISEQFVPVRFDGSLTFVNVAYFEDIILEALSDFPQAKAILVVGSAINEIDASGEEKVREVAERLQQRGVKLMFSGLKHQVKRLLERAGVVDMLGPDAFFPDKETALRTLCATYGECAEGSTRQPRLTEQPAS